MYDKRSEGRIHRATGRHRARGTRRDVTARVAAALALLAWVAVGVGCKRDEGATPGRDGTSPTTSAATSTPPQPPGGATIAEPARPAPEPPAVPAELSFVPASATALVRVDLRALAAGDEARLEMLDWLLRAQQPAAWDFLQGVGVAPGKELGVLYLVAGPTEPGAAEAAPVLVGAAGDLPLARMQKLLRRSGRKPRAVGAGQLYLADEVGDVVGAHEGNLGHDLGEGAIGIAEGLLLFGAPALVEQALTARVGDGPGVQGALADDLRQLDTKAAFAAVGSGAALLGDVAPGVTRVTLVGTLPAEGAGTIVLTAECESEDAAASFRRRLRALLATGATLAGNARVGAALRQLRNEAKIEVSGNTVTARAPLGTAKRR